MGFREIKNTARRNLHTAMRVPASYYATPLAQPVLIHVRVHTKKVQQGDLKGTNLNYAEREEVAPQLLFDREEVPMPPRNSVVIIDESEGYRIGQAEPPDGMTVSADVSRLSTQEIYGKVLPGSL